MLVKIETYNDGEYWCARGIGHAIFTQGKTYESLLEHIREAVNLHFDDRKEAPEVLLISELKSSRATAAAGKR
jgi:predicted RNase H-like HicB family nuclease